MPFRKFPTMPILGGAIIHETRPVATENGNIVDEDFDTSMKLPPVENYELGALLKAGVRLEDVNSKIVGFKSVDVAEIPDSEEV